MIAIEVDPGAPATDPLHAVEADAGGGAATHGSTGSCPRSPERRPVLKPSAAASQAVDALDLGVPA